MHCEFEAVLRRILAVSRRYFELDLEALGVSGVST